MYSVSVQAISSKVFTNKSIRGKIIISEYNGEFIVVKLIHKGCKVQFINVKYREDIKSGK